MYRRRSQLYLRGVAQLAVMMAILIAAPRPTVAEAKLLPDLHWRCQLKFVVITASPPRNDGLDFTPEISTERKSDWLELRSIDHQILKVIYGPDDPTERRELKITEKEIVSMHNKNANRLLAWYGDINGLHERYSADLSEKTILVVEEQSDRPTGVIVTTFKCRDVS